MPTYTVEIDGKRYKIAGDRPPTEAEARAAVGAYTTQSAGTQASPQPAHLEDVPSDLPGGGWDQAAAETEPRWYTPQKRGVLSRLSEPISQAVSGAVSGMAELPGMAATLLKAHAKAVMGDLRGAAADAVPLADAVDESIAEPMRAQGRQVMPALREGEFGEAFRRATGRVVPVLGPALNDIRDAIAEGNLAGAAGQGAVLAASGGAPRRGGLVKGAAGPAPQFETALSRLLNRQAAQRMFDVMRPAKKNVLDAQDISLDLARGIPGTDEGGIGVAGREELAARAKARRAIAGRQQEDMQASTQGVGNLQADIIAPLREEAERVVTHTPVARRSEYMEKAEAFHKQADRIEELASDFGGDVPLGALLTQRAASGQKYAPAHDKLPGAFTPAEAEAGKAFQAKASSLAHRAQPATEVIDRKYRVAANAYENLSNAWISTLSNRGVRGLVNLLAGRLGVGGLAGLAASGGSIPWGVAGALAGTLLGESARWGTFRATTYAKLAKALNRGDVREATAIVNRLLGASAVEEGISERERNRRAQRELAAQAEGVVAP